MRTGEQILRNTVIWCEKEHDTVSSHTVISKYLMKNENVNGIASRQALLCPFVEHYEEYASEITRSFFSFSVFILII